VLAKSHVKTGVSTVVILGAAGLAPFADIKVAITAGMLTLFGTLAPDFDQPGSTASTAWIVGRPKLVFKSEGGKRLWRGTRKWWPGTPWVSWLMRLWASLVYRAVHGVADPAEANPHRKFWHTAAGCLGLGGAVAFGLSQAPQWGAAAGVALMAGTVVRPFWRWLKWPVAGVAGLVAWATPALAVAWPVWWGAVTLGCVVHCAGDGCSKQGVPFWWPLKNEAGERWAPIHVLPGPLRFVTGGWGERVVLGLVYAITAGVVWQLVTPGPTAVG
jgi:hypothetical protein